MIIGCNFSVNVGAFYCITVGYTGTDTQNFIPITHEEYHPRRFNTVEYYCLQTLYVRTEETLAYQHTVHTIIFIEHISKTQVYKVCLIIMFLIFIFLTYWNLFHNIINNCNMRYHNQEIYHSYVFTFIKISLKMAPAARAELCNWKYKTLIKLFNWKLC